MIPILFGAAIVLVAAMVYIVLVKRADPALAKQTRANLEERFPPISDAEFLARCSPGVNPEVALRVRRIVAEYFAIEYERVHPSMTFVEDLGR